MEELLNTVLGGIDNEEKEVKKKSAEAKPTKVVEDKQVKDDDKELSKEDSKDVKPWQWTPDTGGSRYNNQGFKRFPDRNGYNGNGYNGGGGGGGYQRYQSYSKPFNRGYGRGGGGGGYRNDYKPYQNYQNGGGSYQGYSQGSQQGYGNGYRKSY